MNNQLIEELYKTIEAKDNIINNQVLEITRLKGKCEILEENNKLLIQQKAQMYEDLDIAYEKIDKAREYIKHSQSYGTMAQVMPHLKPYVNGDDLLKILGDKENES